MSRAHRIFLAVKHPHDVPSWVSHLIYAQSNSKVVGLGSRSAVLQKLRDTWRANPEEYLYTIPSMEAFRRSTPWGPRAVVNEPKFEKRAVMEMRGGANPARQSNRSRGLETGCQWKGPGRIVVEN